MRHRNSTEPKTYSEPSIPAPKRSSPSLLLTGKMRQTLRSFRKASSRSKTAFAALAVLVGLLLVVFGSLASQVRDLDTPTTHQEKAEALAYRIRHELSRAIVAEGSSAPAVQARLSAEQKGALKGLSPNQMTAFINNGEIWAALRGSKGEISLARLDPKPLLPQSSNYAMYLLSDRGTVVMARAPGKNEGLALPPALRKAIAAESQKAGFLRLQDKSQNLLASFSDIAGTNLTILLQNSESRTWNHFMRHSIAIVIAGAIIGLSAVAIFMLLYRGIIERKRESMKLRRSQKRAAIQMHSLRNLACDFRDAVSREECFLMFSIALSHLDVVRNSSEISFLVKNDAPSAWAEYMHISFVKTEKGEIFSRVERASQEFSALLGSPHHRIVERLHDKWRCWLMGAKGTYGYVDLYRRKDRPETAVAQLALMEIMAQVLASAAERLPHIESTGNQEAQEAENVKPLRASHLPSVRSVKVPPRADFRVSRLSSDFEELMNAEGSPASVDFSGDEETQAVEEGELKGGGKAA